MHVVRVIILATLPPSVPQVLDYYWTGPLPRGAVVRTLLGRRTVKAVVLGSTDLASGKMALRNATFQARRISGIVHAQPHVSGVQLSIAEWLAHQYVAGPGTCLLTACPLLLPTSSSSPPEMREVRLRYRISEPESSVSYLSDLARTAHGPVLVIVPDMASAEALASRLSAHAPLFLHSGLGVRAQRSVHRAVADGSARLVIGTRSALFLPWSRVAHIVVEDPSNDAYKQERMPRYSAPDVARFLASCTGAVLTLLAPSPVVTAEHLIRASTLTRSVSRPSSSVEAIAHESSSGGGLFSPCATEALLDATERRAPVLVYSGRKGFSTTAVCSRCRTAPSCTACDIPLRYWRRGSDTMLVCYRCGSFSDLPFQCTACRAGILRPGGFAGSQRIAGALTRILGEADAADVPVLDADLVRGRDDARRVWDRFDAMPRPVLVASSLVFGERYRRRFDTVIVADADALATNPDFRTTERVLGQLEKLLDFGPSRLLIQHRSMDTVVSAVGGSGWDRVIDAELRDRRAFSWPPFTRLALLRIRHRIPAIARKQARTVCERVSRTIEHLNLSRAVTVQGPSASWVPQERGMWTEHILLSAKPGSDAFRTLAPYIPPGVTIDIDPQSVA